MSVCSMKTSTRWHAIYTHTLYCSLLWGRVCNESNYWPLCPALV